MFSEINLQNFKCFDQVSIPLTKINLFVGPNGAGKSSAIQALGLLKQSINNSELEFNGPLVWLDGLQQIVHDDQGQDGAVVLGFGFMGHEIDTRFSELQEVEEIKYSVSCRGESVVSSAQIKGSPYEMEISFGKRAQIKTDFGALITISSANEIGELFKITNWSWSGGISGEFQNRMQDIYQALAELPNSALSLFYLVPPIRGIRLPRHTLGDQPSYSLQEDIFVTTLAYVKEGTRAVSELLAEVAGTPVEINLEPGRKVQIVKAGSRPARSIVGEAFGSNQLLMLLYVLLTATVGSTVAIEEPEIHLHPMAQAKLVKLLLEQAKKKDLQLIIATHSQHILTGMGLAVHDNVLQPDQLRIHEFSLDGNALAHIDEVPFAPDTGLFNREIEGFFDEGLEGQEYLRKMTQWANAGHSQK